MDIFKAIGVARLTKDAELKYTASGHVISKFSVAVQGFKKDEVDFFDCQCWGKLAEALTQYLKKGTKVAIEGRLKNESWEKDGEKKRRTVINLESIELLSPKKNTDNIPADGTGDDGSHPASDTDWPQDPQDPKF
jgi:single-strand DNA-binding protein